MSQPGPPPIDRLNGWGEIATYLGCDVRTAQRWEKQQALPVYRNDGVKPRVWAFKRDIDEWWKRNSPAIQDEPAPQLLLPRPTDFRRVRRWFAIPASAAVVLVFFTLTRQKSVSTSYVVPDRIFARAEAEGDVVRSVKVQASTGKLALSPDQKYLYIVDSTARPSRIEVIDLDRLSVVRMLPIKGLSGAIAFGKDGGTIYLGTVNDGLKIIERDTLRTVRVRDGINTKVNDIVMTPDGTHAFLALETGGLKRYDVRERQIQTVWTDRCPEFLALDPAGRCLYVSTGCGPGRSTAHDTIEVMDLATESTVRVLKGPPMVTPALSTFPHGDRLWASGMDACLNASYRLSAPDCPEFPATIDNVFRSSDGAVVSIPSPHVRFSGGPALITPEGNRAILGGMPPRVLDTTFFQEQEAFGTERGDPVPVLDSRRHRVYVAGTSTGRIYAVNLPARDCDPPARGRIHLWTGDGTPNDKTNLFPLSVVGQVMYVPGLVGRAFDLTGGSLAIATPYSSLAGFSYSDGTVEGWFKLSGPGEGNIAEFRRNDKRVWTLSVGGGGRLVFDSSVNGPLVADAQPTRNAWHHFALVRQDRDARLYIDGVLALEFGGTKADAGESTLRFGSFAGRLDELAVYERPLPEDEIRGIIATTRSCLTGTPR